MIIEGADGSGKSAVADLAVRTLGEQGRRTRMTRRTAPDGPSHHAALIEAVGALFAAADDLRAGCELLSVAAAAQYAAIVDGQVLPALRRGEVVIADSWWAKTWARLSIEATYLHHLNDAQVHKLRAWQQALLPGAFVPPAHQLTLLLRAPEDDRVRWYDDAGCRDVVYSPSGTTSYEPTDFGRLTTALDQLLSEVAAQQDWPILVNHHGRLPREVAAEMTALIEAHLSSAPPCAETICGCA
ncbi:hypothetical protein OG339_47345 (plasmid) [Streptosporangium sp. NBC_01495]|uniref:hypothetical protein n=1 Tax=Streptosporangium sp. NBC_01495 TaxID=2903899 RepID=UPI002E2F4BF3|nr:hypothetical protein [Streptosporangium sp. NBC_01495]